MAKIVGRFIIDGKGEAMIEVHERFLGTMYRDPAFKPERGVGTIGATVGSYRGIPVAVKEPTQSK